MWWSTANQPTQTPRTFKVILDLGNEFVYSAPFPRFLQGDVVDILLLFLSAVLRLLYRLLQVAVYFVPASL